MTTVSPRIREPHPLVAELTKLRAQQRYKRTELAALIRKNNTGSTRACVKNCCQQTIFHWETGRTSPRIEDFVAWAGALGFEIRMHMREDPEKDFIK